ncbi:hypothetical protein KQX54_001332 [Cotesia glomerata]|uniref:Uncharacterized protein n=1 Tax=Cotesia glomerata TaxID=32391 RepID=A0AAV7II34_COTGL|nr:hypothetical protein KQX54_001332 [Cotesia glomerata]
MILITWSTCTHIIYTMRILCSTLFIGLAVFTQQGYASCLIEEFMGTLTSTNIYVVAIFGIAGAMRGGEFPELQVQDVEDTGSQLIVTILKTKTDTPRTFVIGAEYRNKILQYKALRPKNSNTDSQSSATVTHTLTSTIQTAPNLQLTAHPMTEAPKIYSTPITSSAVTNTVTSSSIADTPKTIASPITHKITSTTTAHTTTTTTITSSTNPINSTVLNNTSRASSEDISSPLEMDHDLVMDYFNDDFSAPIEEKKTEHSKSSSKPVRPNTHSPNSGLLDAKRRKKISLKNDDIQNILKSIPENANIKFEFHFHYHEDKEN